MICGTCSTDKPAADCNIVVIDTDTSGTVVTRPTNADPERIKRFTNRYHSLVDAGRYPNMTQPQVECSTCLSIRRRELEEEAEYWRRQRGEWD